MKKILIAVIVTILVNIGMGAVASATQDPRPWSIKPTIELTVSDK